MNRANTSWLRRVQRAINPQAGAFSPSRRTFLETTSKSALGLAIFPELSFLSKKPQATIAVIGAGLAGLTVAYRLQQAGVKATVFEASNRVGGRVLTTHSFASDGRPLEIGGEFISASHKELLALANELGLGLAPSGNDQEPPPTLIFRGQHFTQKDLQDELSAFRQTILNDAAALPNDLSWKNASAFRHFDEISAKQYLQKIGLQGWPCEFICEALTCEHGLDADRLSAVQLLSWFRQNEEQPYQLGNNGFQLAEGNAALPQSLADKLKGQMELGHLLVRIKQLFSGYELEFDTGGGNRKLIVAEYVVLALPFSLLRKTERKVFFSKKKITAIEQLAYGTGSRLLLEFRPHTRAKGDFLLTDDDGGIGRKNSQSAARQSTVFSWNQSGQRTEDFDAMMPEDATQKCLEAMENSHPGWKKSFTGKALKFSWGEAPFALGSRSCYAVGQYAEFAGAEIEPEENVFFAGEHCSLQFKGTMNGAVQTANWTAKALLSRLQGTALPELPKHTTLPKDTPLVQKNGK